MLVTVHELVEDMELFDMQQRVLAYPNETRGLFHESAYFSSMPKLSVFRDKVEVVGKRYLAV